MSYSMFVPLSHRGWNGIFAGPDGKPQLMWRNSVAPDYFQTMRIPVHRGRDFSWKDNGSTTARSLPTCRGRTGDFQPPDANDSSANVDDNE